MGSSALKERLYETWDDLSNANLSGGLWSCDMSKPLKASKIHGTGRNVVVPFLDRSIIRAVVQLSKIVAQSK